MFVIQKEKVVLNSHFIVDEGLILYTDAEKRTHDPFARMKLRREDAAAVFIYNKDLDKVILTRQFRYAIAAKTPEPILEIMAGKIAPEEDPLETVVREGIEECGYRIKSENIRQIASFFASPGYTSEKFHLYHAVVTNNEKVTDGGGLQEENEYIEVVEMSYNAFLALLDEGKIEDAKTLIAALLVKLNNNYSL